MLLSLKRAAGDSSDEQLSDTVDSITIAFYSCLRLVAVSLPWCHVGLQQVSVSLSRCAKAISVSVSVSVEVWVIIPTGMDRCFSAAILISTELVHNPCGPLFLHAIWISTELVHNPY